MKSVIAVSFALLSTGVWAALRPIAPVDGACVARVPEAQKKVMALPTLAARLDFLRQNGKLLDDPSWRLPLPLVLEIDATQGEKGPWKVLIGKTPDLSDARIWYLSSVRPDAVSGRAGVERANTGRVRIEVPRPNLEIGARYYWKVVSRGRCGFGCHPKHGCKDCTRLSESPVAEFVTESCAPRWIEIEGDVHNIRDLGGRVGLNGRRVRQGLVYRGQGLNENSATGETKGRNRLTVEDVRYLKGTLGVKTDLDLRGPGETADLAESPLGPGVSLVKRSSACYAGIFAEWGKRAMAENFRVFCRRENYPIYLHCSGGADRTGALAYMINGILGVSRQGAETDWESTFYPRIPDANTPANHWCRESHFNTGLDKYGAAGDGWNRKVELYLKDCGITDAEIAAVREILLEPSASAPELAYNIDCWAFGGFFFKPAKSDPDAVRKGGAIAPENYGWFSADEKGAVAYVDDILRGAVTRLVMNVNGQRSNVDSRAFEPVWRNGVTNGMPDYDYVRLMKDFHDRGIDYYAVWTRRCREKGVQPWMSIRMNDMHSAHQPNCPSISDFWRRHPEFRRYPNSIPKDVWFWESQCLDFAHVEVRDRIYNYIVEVLNKYDIDGLELDWTRFAWVFAPGKERENAPLLTGLMRRIRQAANETARRRRHPILISCRMLATPESELAFGRDVDVWGHEGLMDIVDVGNHFETPDFEIPVERWRKVLGDRVQVVPHVDYSLAFDWCDGKHHTRRLLREEYLGWADVMQSRGCRDLSLFNLFGHPRSSPENVLALERGLVGSAVAAESRRYPLSHRDRCFAGPKDPAYPPRLPIRLNQEFACSVPVGTVSGSAQLILGLGTPGAPFPFATVNGVRTGVFTPCSEVGCHGLVAPVPITALKSGHNTVTLSASSENVLVYLALRITP